MRQAGDRHDFLDLPKLKAAVLEILSKERHVGAINHQPKRTIFLQPLLKEGFFFRLKEFQGIWGLVVPRKRFSLTKVVIWGRVSARCNRLLEIAISSTNHVVTFQGRNHQIWQSKSSIF